MLVTLTNETGFLEEEITTCARYNLDHTSSEYFPKSISRLRKIVRKHKPDLVLTQLYFSTIIGGISISRKIPFVFSIHSFLSKDAFEANKLSLHLERLTYNKNHAIISVSEVVFKDYAAHIKVKGQHFILNNFISRFFLKSNTILKDGIFRQ